MNKVTNIAEYKIKKILGSMSDIVINDKKRNRLMRDIMKKGKNDG